MTTTKKKEEPLFVGISDNVSIHSNILESSKELLLILKNIEKIKQLRSEKLKQASCVESLLKEIKILLNKLNKKLPRLINNKIKPLKIKVEEKPKIISSPQQPKVTRQKSELEKIEEEIAFIENKLKQV